VEVYLPALGWVGIDPTNNTWVTDKHVVLAVGRHFNDCSPAKGMFKGPANQALSVFVSVGYEDGFVFEENNAVELPPMLLGAPAIDAAQAMQQQ
jgi:transglutaminase-like putative cysteine protease